MIIITILTRDSAGTLHESSNISPDLLGPGLAERLSLDDAERFLCDVLGYQRAQGSYMGWGLVLEHPATGNLLSITSNITP